ncbi:hypothetical protein Rs2_48262 [Raphanus sativus]|nr:hypothetical protein Rs2_51417 [Raphanus sativus]KAJ4870147.1 hypothetical protein Rs2_48262 [Raphanus sativus]
MENEWWSFPVSGGSDQGCGNTFRSRIRNLNLCKKVGGMERVAVLKRLAPEQHKGMDNPVKGLQVFEQDGIYNPTAKAILESLPESHQFFKICIRTPSDLRRVLSNQPRLLQCNGTETFT